MKSTYLLFSYFEIVYTAGYMHIDMNQITPIQTNIILEPEGFRVGQKPKFFRFVLWKIEW